jgi:hypothetical protein
MLDSQGVAVRSSATMLFFLQLSSSTHLRQASRHISVHFAQHAREAVVQAVVQYRPVKQADNLSEHQSPENSAIRMSTLTYEVTAVCVSGPIDFHLQFTIISPKHQSLQSQVFLLACARAATVPVENRSDNSRNTHGHARASSVVTKANRLPSK